MKILVSWLKEFVTVPHGPDGPVSIGALAEALTTRGFEVGAIEPWPTTKDGAEDAVLDLEITTNRPDCLSVLGIAREVGATYDTEIAMPELASSDDVRGEAPLSITIDDPNWCPRYVGAVANVEVGPSPQWLRTRLEAADVRPVNNVVDVTNYVMLEIGHPMHAFDHAQLAGPEIHVRRAAHGERIRTLDGVERTLTPETLTIADAERPQAVAGVMGSATSEISDGTRTVVLEAAYFDPISVRRTSKRLSLTTDASYRFERGADVSAPVTAIARALQLLTAIGAGQIRGPAVDCYPAPPDPIVVRLRHRRIGKILGQNVEASFVRPTLARLGFTAELEASKADPVWRVTVPSFRVDVHREEDLIEEVVRHHGYDNLPATFPKLTRPAPAPGTWRARDAAVRQLLTGCGFFEAITYGFVELDAALAFHADETDIVALSNPLSEKGAVLRPSLLPGLFDSLVHNRRRERQDVRLFEVGSRFRQRDGETPSLALVMTGAAVPPHWSENARRTDFFDLTGVITRLCAGFGGTATFSSDSDDPLVPGRTARVGMMLGSETHDLGLVGQLDPTLATRRGLPGKDDVYVAELDLRTLSLEVHKGFRAAPIPRHPSVTRDLSIEIDDALPAAQVRDTIRQAAGQTLISIREVARYRGASVAAGAVSLSVRLTFRAPEHTLTDAEVRTSTDRVVSALERAYHAKLR